MTVTEGSTLITSVRRALRVIEVVAEAPRATPVKVIARSLGLSLGTTYNIVRTLVRDEYLTLQGDGVVLGDRILGLGRAGEPGFEFAMVRSALRRVAIEADATAYMSRYEDGEVRVADFVESGRVPPPDLWVGVSQSAHATAFGKQILAELPAAERLDYLGRHPLVPLTPNTIRDRRFLLSQFDGGTGVTQEIEEYALGFACVAVAVRAPGVVASIALALPARRLPAEVNTKAQLLRTQGAKLSLQLGAGRFLQLGS